MENELIIADQIDGISHPAECEHLVGHDDVIKTMLSRYASGRMHHHCKSFQQKIPSREKLQHVPILTCCT